MIADQNMNVLAQCGENAVYFASIVPAGGMPAAAVLVPASGGSDTKPITFKTIAEIVFKLVVNEMETTGAAG